MNLKDYILDVQDFPQPGVVFKDITPLLKDPDAFKEVVDQMSAFVLENKATAIVAPEARGFVFASAVAYVTKTKFILVRKPGKLPQKTYQANYTLEYGSNILELQQDDLQPIDRVVIIDDILATGGTIDAIIELVNKSQATVAGICFLADITGLNDGDLEKRYPMKSLVKY